MGAPTVLAKPSTTIGWDTFYSPEFKFSVDYPINSNITNEDLDASFSKMFMQPEVSLVAMVVTNSSVDPQELAVSRSLNLSGGDELLAGGVQPLVQDTILRY